MESALTLEQVKIIGDAPQVKKNAEGQPVMSPEVVVIAAFQLKDTGTDANVQVRGVSGQALELRRNVRIVQGRFFQPGLPELVAGRNASLKYRNLEFDMTHVQLGGQTWSVVGIMDAGGSAFDSEVWCDASILNQTFKRPENIFQSLTVAMVSPDVLTEFKDSLTTDPRLTSTVFRETAYYEKQIRDGGDDDPGAGFPGGVCHGDRCGLWSVEHDVCDGIGQNPRNCHASGDRLPGRQHCPVVYDGIALHSRSGWDHRFNSDPADQRQSGVDHELADVFRSFRSLLIFRRTS